MYTDGNREVRTVGEPTAGGAHAVYEAFYGEGRARDGSLLGQVKFQHDTIPNVGVVGWTNEALLSVVIHRLQAFQDGGFPCDENAAAITGAQAALAALESRTVARTDAGVEGEHKPAPQKKTTKKKKVNTDGK
jgi:hypothetical protein